MKGIDNPNVRTLYVVMGSTGEYSDRYEWPVIAFPREHEAQACVEDCTKAANDIQVRLEAAGGRYCEEGEAIMNEGRSFDRNFQMDYTGTRYFYVKVPFCADCMEAALLEDK